MAYYVPPPKKVGGHVLRVSHQTAPMLVTMACLWRTTSRGNYSMRLAKRQKFT